MGFKNSPAHMQCFMDKILRDCQDFSRCFIDDVVIYSGTFEEHLQHVANILAIFQARNVAVNPLKCFFAFDSVKLLGHCVDKFGLTTLEDKVIAISNIALPTTLGQLEHFLGLTGYYRQFVESYAWHAAPLQHLKTSLLRVARPDVGPLTKAKQAAASHKRIPPELLTPEVITAFETIKAKLSAPRTLAHYDSTVPLLVYLDASKERGYAACVHQVPHATMAMHSLTVDDVVNNRHPSSYERPVMFLSKLLNRYERNYFSTELEITNAVWIARKIQHLIHDNQSKVIFYTDHSAIVNIKDSTSLQSNHLLHQHRKFVNISIFFSQFGDKFEIRHKLGASMLNADPLSRLPATTDASLLDCHHATISLLSIDTNKAEELARQQEADYALGRIVRHLKQNPDTPLPDRRIFELIPVEPADSVPPGAPPPAKPPDPVHLLFAVVDRVPCLCIPQIALLPLLYTYHDARGHPAINMTYTAIRNQYYVRNLGKRLTRYVNASGDCQRHKARPHKPFGSLRPYLIPTRPFETVAIDFLLGLPPSVPR